ncbi:uncharacterized protein [Haliotis asinina]|uniref:uncharacterized protein n=1 Tax=Haliotis asinina TaxID=109174 RepID=UPI00353246E1
MYATLNRGYTFSCIQSTIEITVQVYDYDDASDDHMDTLFGMMNIRAASTKDTAIYRPYILASRTELKIAVRAYCAPDWYGSACERYCSTTPGYSHYTCHYHTGAKMCFEGTQCEIVTNQCVMEPCLNGGTCNGNETDYECECPVEWTGKTCAEKVNFCDNAPCDKGNCTPDLLIATRFKCNCEFSWVGDRCSQSVDIINITLLGEIDHTNRGDLADGLNRLITELGGIPGRVDVKLTTNIQKGRIYTTTDIQLYFALDNGSFLDSVSVERIFESNSAEVISDYLPLTLYPPQDEEKENMENPHNDWNTSQYVSAILNPVGLVLMTVLLLTVLLLVASCIRRRRSNNTQQCRDHSQISSLVMDVAFNPRLPGAITGNLQEASVSPDGYTSLRFPREDEESPDIHCDDTSNISLAAEDSTLDPEDQPGFGFYPNDDTRLGKAAACATDDISNIHIKTEDVTLDDVIAHCFRVSPNDNVHLGDAALFDTNCDDTTKLHLSSEDMTHNQLILHGLDVSPNDKASHGDVATTQEVTNDLTLDPDILRGARASPHDNAGPGDEVATSDTNYDGTSNALATAEARSLSSVCLQEPGGYKNYKPHLDTRRRVASYIQPVPGDISLDTEKEDAEYTVIHDKDVEDLSLEDPYETLESLDDDDVEDISQKDTYEKIGL